MAKIQLDIPTDLHLAVKEVQLQREVEGNKINLKDLYYEVIQEGLLKIKE